MTLALSPKARKALSDAGVDEADIVRMGWRRFRDAGADLATLQEIEAALGREWPEHPEVLPATWIIGGIVLLAGDHQRARVDLLGDTPLRVPMTTKEARVLKVGDVVRVSVKAVRS